VRVFGPYLPENGGLRGIATQCHDRRDGGSRPETALAREWIGGGVRGAKAGRARRGGHAVAQCRRGRADDEVPFGSRTVQNYLALAAWAERETQDFERLHHLGLSKLCRMASLPRDLLGKLKIDEPIRVRGAGEKTIEVMTIAELDRALGVLATPPVPRARAAQVVEAYRFRLAGLRELNAQLVKQPGAVDRERRASSWRSCSASCRSSSRRSARERVRWVPRPPRSPAASTALHDEGGRRRSAKDHRAWICSKRPPAARRYDPLIAAGAGTGSRPQKRAWCEPRRSAYSRLRSCTSMAPLPVLVRDANTHVRAEPQPQRLRLPAPPYFLIPRSTPLGLEARGLSALDLLGSPGGDQRSRRVARELVSRTAIPHESR
jgi:hypothetical protein